LEQLLIDRSWVQVSPAVLMNMALDKLLTHRAYVIKQINLVPVEGR